MKNYKPNELVVGQIYSDVNGFYKYVGKSGAFFQFIDMIYDEEIDDFVPEDGYVLRTIRELRFY